MVLTRLAIGAVLSMTLVLTSLPGASSGASGTHADKIRGEMDGLIAAGAPGVIVLIRQGDKTDRLAAGLGTLSPKVPMLVTDRTRVGSLVKTFVAVIVLQLVGEGKLSLDDTVERRLPGLVPNGERITVRQLLNHTSGIFDYWQDPKFFDQLVGDPTYAWPPKRLVQIGTAHPSLSAPGEKWSYSNTNYILLGLLVEATTGRALRTELAARIFTRLKLKQTSLDNSPRIAGTHVRGYAVIDKPPMQDVTMVSPTAAWAAGGLVSTADDIADFNSALLGGRVLRHDLLRHMLTTVRAREGLDYGLGIARVRLPCGGAWGHQGEFPGYLNFVLGSRDGKRQVVVLVNSGSLSNQGQAVFQRILASGYCG